MLQSPEVDDQLSEEVEGIIHLGELTGEYEFAGHSFGLRTLRAGEEIAAGKVIEGFRNTLKEPEAWAAAQVALALTHIDGDEDFCPQVNPSQQAFARARLNYLTTNWYWVVIDFLFQQYTALQSEALEKVREIQNLSPGSLLTSWPSPDSFAKSDTSSGSMNLETLDPQ